MVQLQELLNTAVQIFRAADLTQLGIMLVAILIASFLMQSYRSLLNVTALALILSVVGTYMRPLLLNGAEANQLALNDWNKFLSLDAKTLFVYAVSFAIFITVVYSLRALVSRSRDNGDNDRNTTMGAMQSQAVATDLAIITDAPMTAPMTVDAPRAGDAGVATDTPNVDDVKEGNDNHGDHSDASDEQTGHETSFRDNEPTEVTH